MTRTPVADEIERSIPPENLTPEFRRGMEIAVRIARAFERASAPAPVESAPGARLCPECADTGTRTFGGGPCSKGCRAPASPPAAEPPDAVSSFPAIAEHVAKAFAIQTPACDRCSVGVMDQDNPHWLGICQCECHRPAEPGTCPVHKEHKAQRVDRPCRKCGTGPVFFHDGMGSTTTDEHWWCLKCGAEGYVDGIDS